MIPQTVNKTQIKTNYDLLMQQELKKVLKLNHKPNLLLHSCCAPCSSYVLKLLRQFFNVTVYFYNSNLYPLEEYEKRLNEQKKLIERLNAECDVDKINIDNNVASNNVEFDLTLNTDDIEKNSAIESEIAPENQSLNKNNKYIKLGKKQSFENYEFTVLQEGVFVPTEIKIVEGEYDQSDYLKTIKGYEKELEGGNRCYLCYLMRVNKAGELALSGNFDYFTTTLTVSPYKNAENINKIGKMVSEKLKVNFLFSDFKKNDGYKKSIEYSEEYELYRQNYCGCKFSLLQKQGCLV